LPLANDLVLSEATHLEVPAIVLARADEVSE
jgi:hypothetical protein